MQLKLRHFGLGFLVAASCLLAATPATRAELQEDGIDYQKTAEGAWPDWQPQMASVLYSMGQYNGEYEIHLVRKAKTHDLELRFVDNDKAIYAIRGHKGTVFRVVDNVLYYADFNPGASGGDVVAYDFTQQKVLWRSRLQAMGPVEHSAYSNPMTLDANSQVVSIRGHEGAGDYIEFLHVKTGKTVGHRIFLKA